MMRFLTKFGLLFGIILLGLAGTLTYARRDEPKADWVVFSVKQKTDLGFDIYRVLSDGTHTRQIASTHDQYPTLWGQTAGWIALEDRYMGYKQLQLVHMLGYQRVIMQGTYGWASLLHYDASQHMAYVSATDDWQSDAVTNWAIDVTTGERTRFELPLKLENIRAEFEGGGYIVWSDYQSKGDLYGVSFENPPRVQRLTTRGDVLSEYAPIAHTGWAYYFVEDGDPDPYVALYRIRTDGSGEQQVAEQVLDLPGALYLGWGDEDFIYYWAGAVNHPHLVRARPDGSEPFDLPIPLVKGWSQGWSPDKVWVYYGARPPLLNAPDSVLDLRRLNMQTGENQLIGTFPNPQQLIWSTDGQWLILITGGDNGYLELHRMRPDGSDDTVLADDLRSDSLSQLRTVPILTYSTWGKVGSELHLLDLDTLEIHHLHDDAPPSRIRQIMTTLPMPDNEDGSLGWLVAIGVIGLGAGIITLWKDGHDVNKTPV